MKLRRILSALFTATLAASCGGTGSIPQLTPITGKKLVFGFYGSDNKQISETKQFVNVAWVMGWGEFDSFTNYTNQLNQAHNAGITRIVLGVGQIWEIGGETKLRVFLTSLQNQGLLKNIWALYPIDEPDRQGKTGTEVEIINAKLRQICSEYAELKGCKLAVIYGPIATPGIRSYDLVSYDNYNARESILADGTWQSFESKLSPTQQAFFTIGGASPWKQDPDPFYQYALGDPKVVAMIVFCWPDNLDPANGVGLGVRSNGMAPIYSTLGKQIKDANP